MIEQKRTGRQMKAAHLLLERKFFPRNIEGGFRPRMSMGGISVKRDCALARECEVWGCANSSAHRIGINVWGVLVEKDVCEQHKSKDGIWTDGI